MLLKKIFRHLLFFTGAIVFAGFLMLNFVYPLTLGKTNVLYTDFGKFYNSQRCFIQGENIYAPLYFVQNKINKSAKPVIKSLHSKVLKLSGNLNPPFFTLISFPFAYLSYSNALIVWTSLSILAGALSILLLQQKIDPTSFSAPCILLLLMGLFAYFPSFANLQFGQISLLLLLLLVLGWRAAHDEKTVTSAIFLGLAASIKPFIALFLFYFLIRREWRGVTTFIVTLLSTILFSMAFLGAHSYLAYYHTCQQILWAASSWNVSIYGFLLRLIGGIESNVPVIPLPGLITWIYPPVAGLFFFAIIRFLWPTTNIPSQQKTDLDFSLIIVSMLLLSPLGWLYYFPFLVIPFLILWQFAKKGIYPNALPLWLMTFILLSNMPIRLLSSDQITAKNVYSVFIGSTLYFSVLIGLTCLLFLLRYRLAGKFLLHFERIPQALLLLVGMVVFLPSIIGISKEVANWIAHSTDYTKEYSLVAPKKPSHQD